MRILVVGGAGYIGSHMTKLLREDGHEPVVLDNFSSGFRDAVAGAEVIDADLAERAQIERVFAAQRFDGVMHFASCIQVGESVASPAKYYRNNVVGSLNLLEAMLRHGVARIIFSSSAAVYGEPRRARIDELHPKAPVSPYGRTKWMIEQVLADFDRAYRLRHSCLRYFNAAGAAADGILGERHEPDREQASSHRGPQTAGRPVRRRSRPAATPRSTRTAIAVQIAGPYEGAPESAAGPPSRGPP